MPIDKQKGPGGVSASYGTRASKKLSDRQSSGEAEKVVPSELWSAGQVVYASDIRRLPTGENIVCVVGGTTGTTAPVIPHGAAPAAIVDNTATWWALDIYDNTFVENSGTSALTTYNFFNSPQNFFYGSAPNLYTSGGSGATTQSRLWALLEGGTTDNGFGANGRFGKYATREFDTDSDILDIGFFSITSGQPFERFQILVDGKPLFNSPYKPSTNGSTRHLRVRLSKGRGDKNVVISSYGAMILTNVAVPSDCYIRYPANPGEVLGMFTDSFGDTESPSFQGAHEDLTPTVARSLGFKHVVMAGVGGTSYSVDSGSRKGLNALIDLNNIKSLSLDAIVIGQGYNAGQSSATPSVEATAARSAWAKLRAAFPGAPMVIIGSWYQNPTASAGHAAIQTALSNAFLEHKDPNTVFINPFDSSIVTGKGQTVQAASGPWFSTAVASWAIPPVGGSFDGAHPSPAGRVFLTDKVSKEAKKAFAAIGKNYS